MIKLNFSRILSCFVGIGSAAAVLANTSAVNASIFTVKGTKYDVKTVQGTFSELSTTLAGSPWWGDKELARAFVQDEDVQNKLQWPNYLRTSYYGDYVSYGPIFVFGSEEIDIGRYLPDLREVPKAFTYNTWGSVVDFIPLFYIDERKTYYAIATEVSGNSVSVPDTGGTIPTAVVSLVALGMLRKSRKSMVSKTRIANP